MASVTTIDIETKDLKKPTAFNCFKVFTKTLIVLIVGIMLFRTFAFDLIWLLPRQPITGGLLQIIFPRLITLNCPSWIYSILSVFFDGDGTPIFLLGAYLLLYVSGINLSHYFSKLVDFFKGRSKITLMTFSIFVLYFFSPMSWILRLVAAEINHQNLSVQHGKRLFNAFDHIFNTLYHEETLSPDLTFVYKSIPLESLQNQSCLEQVFLPGDSLHPHSEIFRNFYEEGKLELDVYLPEKLKTGEIENPGVVLHLHGGGWDKGHRHFLKMNYHGGVPKTILEEQVIVSVSYRLSCTGINGMEILEDVVDAAKFIQQHAASWGADGNKIVPWGTSAGGTLALLLAFKYNEQLPIKGVINFYGVVELREEKVEDLVSSFYEKFHANLFLAGTRHICKAGNLALEDQEKCFEEFSPVAHVDENSPPTLTVHGEQDGLVLINQAFHLQRTLIEFNVPETTIAVQGVHDCDVFSSSLCGQAAVKAVRNFLDQVV